MDALQNTCRNFSCVVVYNYTAALAKAKVTQCLGPTRLSAAFAAGGALTFVVEAVHLVDGGRLVVAPQQKEVVGVLDLVAHKKTDRLQAPLAPVHVVSAVEQKYI